MHIDLNTNRKLCTNKIIQTLDGHANKVDTFLIGVGVGAQPTDFPFDRSQCYGTRELRGPPNRKYYHFRDGRCLRAPIGTVTVAEQTPYYGNIRIPYCEMCFWRLQGQWPHSRLIRF